MICAHCHRDLPEERFSPSLRKRKCHHCKDCMNKWAYQCNKRYAERIKDLPNKEFDMYYGGFNVKILNFVRKSEYRYVIESTDGKTLKTNDGKEFMAKINEIVEKFNDKSFSN